jgi:FkbM family methyltransferase
MYRSPIIGFKRRTLPNGLEVAYQSKVEVDYFYRDIFEKQVYAKNGISIGPGDCVFDVGANIGLFTLFVHTYFKDVESYSFEPAPPLFEILKANTSAQAPRANLFNCGLSNAEKTSKLTFYPNSSGMSSFYADLDEEKDVLRSIMVNQMEQGMAGMDRLMKYADELLEERLISEIYECRLTTLSSFLRERNLKRIDLLKIDVQKSELDILQGIEDVDWERIRQIVIEVHDIDDRLNRISRLLRDRGFGLVVEQDDLYEGSVMYNVYAIKPAAIKINPASFQRPQDRAKKYGEALKRQKQLINLRRKDK